MPCDAGGARIFSKEQEYKTYYTYEDGYYDRETKEFYGFAKVTKRSEGGTVQETEYYNDKYYRKGMVKKSKTIYGGFTYNEKEIEVDTSPHARIIKEEVIQREKENPYSYLKTSKRYVYDKYGNVTKLYDEGDVTKANDDITAEITYWKGGSEEAYFKAHPEKIEVKDTNNKLLRKREGSYDSKTGALTELKQYTSQSAYLVNRIEWTDEGSIKAVTAPTGKRIEYKYLDGIYPIEIKEISSKGDQTYTSKIEWDSVLGVKLKETDSANNTMTYKYDGFGRVTEVRSPYDTDKTPYAKYTYFTPEERYWYTITENKISTRKEDKAVMKTIVLHDGLGRINYTAKEGEVYIEGTIDSTQTGWNVSGAVYYDEDGRKKGEGQPVFYGGDIQNELSGSSSQILLYEKLNELKHPTSYEYDGLGRVIKTILPDGNSQKTEYSIDASLQITKTTDPLENINISKKDIRGNIKEVERRDKNNTLLTKAKYEYSVLGEMLRAYDAKDNLLAVNYDMLGRRISLESLDMGRKEWNYDDKGRLEYENDSVLRSKLASIKYEYDGLDRIIKIDYPFSEDVEYEYGVPGEKGAGEVIRKKDETGETMYSYGLLNEVKVETRTIKRGREFQKPVTAVFNYEADYLGRMQSISYPDGEVLTYSYDKGGQLKGVIGKKGIETYRYVDNILYDEHSQRVYIKYGNGVETRYNYDEKRRWLKDIKTENKDKNLVFQKINYNFDAVGNVEGYINTASKYETSQSYSYDALYQLIKAEGTHKQYGGINPNPDNPHPSNPLHTNKYRQTFAFDIIGNMTNKDSTTNITGGSISSDDTKLNYELDYEYDSKYAHRLIRAGNRYYRYDANGNITAEKDGKFSDKEEITFTYSYFAEHDVYGVDYGFDLEPPEDDPANLESGGTTTGGGIQGGYRRDYTWNERNLLIKSDDKLNTVIYRYGDDGRRALKFTQQSNSETLYFNNFYSVHQVAHEPNHEHGLRVSKHIFVGNSRLVTAMTHADNNGDTTEQTEKRYYYHADHLQSAQFITNARGEQYEHIEYTPYGELWIEETAPGIDKLPFRFTGKELDEETGLYYYGARYLDPKYSRWLSGDPALNDYMAGSSVGEGGIYNTVNFNIYHYGGNNPIKYSDPTGMYTLDTEDNAPIIIVEKDDNLWNIVKGQSPNLSDKEIQSRVDDIAKLNNLNNPNLIKPGDRLKAPDSVIPDITDDLMAKMEANASDSAILNPFTFRKKVRNKGDWDYKNQKGTIYESGKYNNYFFNGEIITGDAPGNINYGYVGKAAWWASEKLLFKQAGKAQKAAGTSLPEWDKPPYYGDDPNDYNMIKKGIQLYEKRNK
ncbi:LysM peptidoglycan-binding domain-containing protein [Treponema denticola]